MEITDAQTEWKKYDEFTGPALDSGLWEPLSFGPLIRLEPEARTIVEDGVLTVAIPEFTNCDPGNQGLDNSKHVVSSTKGFRLPADSTGRFPSICAPRSSATDPATIVRAQLRSSWPT